MLILAEVFLPILAVVVCLELIVGWVRKKHPKARNPLAFLIACVSAYSASFVIDMVVMVCIGTLPFDNIVLPSLTWLCIAISSFSVARRSAKNSWVIATPFAVTSLLAFSVLRVHAYNFLVGLFLMLIAIIIAIYRNTDDRQANTVTRN